jgi:hypothetical protein
MIYEITSLNGFAKSLGKQVARDGGFSSKELKSYINVKNIKNIITQYASKKRGKFYIDEERTHKVCEEIFDWLTGVNLAKLAAQDYLECYWDDKNNTMVFKKK